MQAKGPEKLSQIPGPLLGRVEQGMVHHVAYSLVTSLRSPKCREWLPWVEQETKEWKLMETVLQRTHPRWRRDSYILPPKCAKGD